MTADTLARPRMVPISTGHNIRDMGGYPAADGKYVRWGMLFRAGYMSDVVGEDAATLQSLGIVTICDLRANGERDLRPTAWHEPSNTELWARDHDVSAADLHKLMESGRVNAKTMRAAMVDLYHALPFVQADSYREMFARLKAGRVPLLFNCSAGKDRTGVAAALILTVLGVSRDIILEDYLLTNATIDNLIRFLGSDGRYSDIVSNRREDALPLLRAEAEYLVASFDVIMAQHGSVDAYLSEILGVSAEDQQAIRSHLIA
jgi:protein-tyrosine phosphatase